MDVRNDFEGVKKLAHPPIPRELLEILCSDREASKEQKKEILEITKKLGKRLYPEILFSLTYIETVNPVIAENICHSITDHKKRMEKKLCRPVLLDLAAMDFMHSRRQTDAPLRVDKGNIIMQIARQAITDSKTKAFSGEQLKIDIQKEMDRTYRYGISFSVIMIDLDHFKAINDTYGHQNGDLVLQFFVSLVVENLRKLDSLYRFGGDEFLILLPQTNIKGAGRIASKLLDLLNNTQCQVIGKNVSVSMGIAAYGSDYSNNYTKLIESADQALYKAKGEGRNLIAFSREGQCEILQRDRGNASKEVLKPNQKIHCQKIVGGCAIGNLFIYKDVYSSRIREYEIKPEEVEIELQRIRTAIDSVIDDLSKMQNSVEKEINKDHGAIFLVHKLILEDQSIYYDIENELNEKLLNGEIIVRNIFRRLEKRFLLFEDLQRKEKAKDIRDIGNRVIRKLQGKDDNLLSSLPENTILLSQRLLPSDTVFLDKKKVKAIITVDGSRGSHSAILARALGIPYVTIQEKIEMLPNQTRAIVDSDGGSIIITPDDKLLEDYTALIASKVSALSQQINFVRPLEFKGRKVSLLANVSSRDEAVEAFKSGAEGIGLFRMENIYLSSHTIPDEDFLLGQFREILNPFKDRNVTIRLVDIGSDKVPSYIDLGNEINPALGLRGIRFLLKHRTFLHTQLAACIKLNDTVPIRIMLPMVSLPSEITQIREKVRQMSGGKKIQIGSMIETPSAIFHIDDILEVSDFISIGTNDLFQYTMAADRENKDVASYYDMGYETLSKPIGNLIKKSRDASKDCTICGEIAGDVEYISSLLKIGLTRFSVLPNLIPMVRTEILGCSNSD